MEMDLKVFSKLIEQALGDSNLEFEVLIKEKFDYISIKNILNLLTHKSDLGGRELPITQDYVLNITESDKTDNTRISLKTLNAIKLYWVKNKIVMDDTNMKWEAKKYLGSEKTDILKANLSMETLLKPEEIKKSYLNINNTKLVHTFRLKNISRITWGNYWVDISVVKMGKGSTFKDSKTLTASEEYEIEIELNNELAIKNGVKTKDLIEELDKIINFLLINLTKSINIISKDQQTKIIDDYMSLVKLKKANANTNTNANTSSLGSKYNNNYRFEFIGANPVTLHIENIVESSGKINILKNYGITYKLDGMRYLLYSYNGVYYGIDINMNILDTGIKCKDTDNGSIIESELVGTKFYCFNVLFFRKTDIRQTHLVPTKVDPKQGRLLNLRELLSNVVCSNVYTITEALYKFGMGEEVFTLCKELWEKRDSFEAPIDGLIFTPVLSYYPPTGRAWEEFFKWKPLNMNSIDFLIKVEKDLENNDKIYPHIKTTPDGESIIIQYKVLLLHVSSIIRRPGEKTIINAIYFNPENEDSEIPLLARAKMPLNEKGQMTAIDPDNGIITPIHDDTIVEFIYDDDADFFKWKALRLRTDKTRKYKEGAPIYGNNELTANDIWKTIKNPITEHIITTGDLTGAHVQNEEIKDCFYVEKQPDYNEFLFNAVYNLIKMTASKVENQNQIKLLEFSTGMGFFLPYWKELKIKDVVSINIDRTCTDYAIKFFKDYPKPKPVVSYIWGAYDRMMFPNYETGLSEVNKKRLKEYIPTTEMFDIATAFFVPEQAFSKQTAVRTLLTNINENLIMGGTFISMGLNGESIFNMLKQSKELSDSDLTGKLNWSLEKLYKIRAFDSSKPVFDKQFKLKTQNITWNLNLVPVKYYIKLIEEYGFTIIDVGNVEKLSKGEVKLSDKSEPYALSYFYLIAQKSKNISSTNRKKALQ